MVAANGSVTVLWDMAGAVMINRYQLLERFGSDILCQSFI